jgi:tetratricopeptide (TPR) repeat protein
MTEPFSTDNPELEALFERYLKSPGSHAFAPLADACRKAGLLEEAIEICEKGVSTHPHYASGFVIRGKCYYDLGNGDQAEASFAQVLELDPHNLVALKYMGAILAERGEAEAARQHFRQILALDPDNKEIAEQLDSLGTQDEGPAERPASTTERRRTAVDETEEDESFVGGEINLGRDEPTPDILATTTLADIFAAQGYRDKAAKIYHELLQAHPGDDEVQKKLQALESDSPAATAPADAPTPPTSQTAAEAEENSAAEPPEAAPKPLEEERSAAQFKRWLENLSR